MKHEHPAIAEYEKVDEIPFDFNRKRLSVVVRRGGEHLLITKGEAESVFAICGTVIIDGRPQPFDESRRAQAAETFQKLSADGFRTLGVAVRKVEKQDAYALAAEQEMTLAGFAAFLDPPKEGILAVLEALNKNGVSVVIMTGDNQYVTQKVAHDVGLASDRIVTGDQVDTMDDAALAYQAEHGAIFARVSPEQKNRVILGLKARGHVVGYIGDGINDAPSLHTADVGISVMNGVDVAKDAAKIILLEKDLAVLNEGVIEGRRCFANIMKYIIMSTSSNFGNMFSMAAASLFLPFLPMLPTQILLNNFLYDTSQVAVPGDNVDPALLHKPKRWQIWVHSPVHDDHRPHQFPLRFPHFRRASLVVPRFHERAAVPDRMVCGVPRHADAGSVCDPDGGQPVQEPSERAVADRGCCRLRCRRRAAVHTPRRFAWVLPQCRCRCWARFRCLP